MTSFRSSHVLSCLPKWNSHCRPRQAAMMMMMTFNIISTILNNTFSSKRVERFLKPFDGLGHVSNVFLIHVGFVPYFYRNYWKGFLWANRYSRASEKTWQVFKGRDGMQVGTRLSFLCSRRDVELSTQDIREQRKDQVVLISNHKSISFHEVGSPSWLKKPILTYSAHLVKYYFRNTAHFDFGSTGDRLLSKSITRRFWDSRCWFFTACLVYPTDFPLLSSIRVYFV